MCVSIYLAHFKSLFCLIKDISSNYPNNIWPNSCIRFNVVFLKVIFVLSERQYVYCYIWLTYCFASPLYAKIAIDVCLEIKWFYTLKYCNIVICDTNIPCIFTPCCILCQKCAQSGFLCLNSYFKMLIDLYENFYYY